MDRILQDAISVTDNSTDNSDKINVGTNNDDTSYGNKRACSTAPRTLYLDCAGGISGDMYVAALLDLGADRQVLEGALSSLNLPGYRTKISEIVKNGIRACDFNVILDTDNHDHDMAYLHPDRYPQAGHAEAHEASHDHHHHGRSLPEIEEILRGGNLSPRALELALKIFRIIAEAEGKVHGKSPEEVHFHEVGAVDSIVDIAAAAVCTDTLGIEKVILSPLTEGCGTVRCQHGILPIPVPAVTAIVESHHLALHKSNIEGELVTPTGAAIAAALSSGEQLPESFVIEKTGIGAGKRDYASCGILRAMLIRGSDGGRTLTSLTPAGKVLSDQPASSQTTAGQPSSSHASAGQTPSSQAAACPAPIYAHDEVICLESNLDDVTGEALGFVKGLLLEAGALDVWETPIYMKKSRPAWQISILCREEQLSLIEDLLFKNTTTIGIRISRKERAILPREIRTINTPWGLAQVKVVRVGSECLRFYPEYESIAALSRASGIGYPELWHKVKAIAENEYQT